MTRFAISGQHQGQRHLKYYIEKHYEMKTVFRPFDVN